MRQGLVAVYRLLDVLKEDGLFLDAMRGPWQAGADPLERRARGRRRYVDYVELGRTRIYADSPGRAQELAGFLNWCEVAEEDVAPDAYSDRVPRQLGR